MAGKKIVIIHGPKASGKTRRANQLLQQFGCQRLIDDWDGSSTLRPGDLALTNIEPPFGPATTARLNSFITAGGTLLCLDVVTAKQQLIRAQGEVHAHSD